MKHEVGHRQEQFLLPFQPLLSGILLAFGAVAIAARMIAVPGFIAVSAVVEMAAQHLGSTLLNGAHGGQMAGQHAWAVLVSIGGSIVTEDIGQFYHVILDTSSVP